VLLTDILAIDLFKFGWGLYMPSPSFGVILPPLLFFKF
jgi:hypothetical protein